MLNCVHYDNHQGLKLEFPRIGGKMHKSQVQDKLLSVWKVKHLTSVGVEYPIKKKQPDRLEIVCKLVTGYTSFQNIAGNPKDPYMTTIWDFIIFLLHFAW